MSTTIDIQTYVEGMSQLQKTFYEKLKTLIEDVKLDVNVTLFARQPYFYLKEHESINFHRRPSIMMAFFKDHVNIFSTANITFEDQLPMYKFTEKHTMQLYFDQNLEEDILKKLFHASFAIHEE